MSLRSTSSAIYGALCLAGAAAVGAVWFANHRARLLYGPGGHDLNGAQYIALFLAVMGVSLFLKLRTAQIAFEMFTTALGAWLIVGSALHVPLPWMLIDVMYGVALLIPLALTITSWRIFRTTALNGS